MRQGELPLFFEWFKNNQTLRASNGAKFEIENNKRSSTLFIQHIAKEDAGNYSCLVKNIHGSDSINVMLTVKGNDNSYIMSSTKAFQCDINVWRYGFHKITEYFTIFPNYWP